MPVVHPYGGEVVQDYLTVDELCLLLTKRPLSILGTLRNASERGRIIRVCWKPSQDSMWLGRVAIHLEDVAKVFDLPKDFVDEIVRLRRRALSEEIVMPLWDGG